MDMKLRQMHNLLCDAINRELSKDEPSPYIYKEAIAILKNHKVEALPVPGSKLGDMAEKLPQNMPFKTA